MLQVNLTLGQLPQVELGDLWRHWGFKSTIAFKLMDRLVLDSLRKVMLLRRDVLKVRCSKPKVCNQSTCPLQIGWGHNFGWLRSHVDLPCLSLSCTLGQYVTHSLSWEATLSPSVPTLWWQAVFPLIVRHHQGYFRVSLEPSWLFHASCLGHPVLHTLLFQTILHLPLQRLILGNTWAVTKLLVIVVRSMIEHILVSL